MDSLNMTPVSFTEKKRYLQPIKRELHIFPPTDQGASKVSPRDNEGLEELHKRGM